METLVIDHGYIGLVASNKLSHVLFNRELLSYASLDAAFDKLYNRAGGIVISGSYGQSAWDFRLHVTHTDVMKFMLSYAEQGRHKAHNRFHFAPLDHNDLHLSSTPELSDVIDLLKSHDYRLSDDVVFKLSGLVQHRIMICENGPTLRGWSVQQIGGGYDNLNIDLGGSIYISDHRNRDYGRWAEVHYDRVWEAGTPAADDIDISLLTGRGRRRRVQYRRILVPINSTNEGQTILSASLSDDSIDLDNE